MDKNTKILIGVIIVLAVVISGCTSENKSSSYKLYNGSAVSFEYPSSWTLNNESEKYEWISFTTEDGQNIRVGYGVDEVVYENFPETKEINNRTYKRLETTVEGMDTTFLTLVVRENGRDFAVLGSLKDEEGMLKLIETFQFK